MKLNRKKKKASLPGRLHGLSSLAIELISNSYTGVPLMVPWASISIPFVWLVVPVLAAEPEITADDCY